MSNMFFAIQLAIETVLVTLSRSFAIKSQKGVTTIEYAFLGILIAVAVVGTGAIQNVANITANLITTIKNAFP